MKRFTAFRPCWIHSVMLSKPRILVAFSLGFLLIVFTIFLPDVGLTIHAQAGEDSGGHAVIQAVSYQRITNDDAIESDAVINMGNVAWFKTVSDELVNIMVMDGSGTRAVDSVAPQQKGALKISNDWVLYEIKDTADNDYDKRLYNRITDSFLDITTAADVDWGVLAFEDGRTLWQTDRGNGLDLAYWDGEQTRILVEAGNYRFFTYGRGGTVVWEQKNDDGYYDIMMYDGDQTLQLNNIGPASDFYKNFLLDTSSTGASFLQAHMVDGNHVAWLGKRSGEGDSELLYYDGGTVVLLTDNAIKESNQRVCGNRVAWVNGFYDVWLFDGQQSSRISTTFPLDGGLSFHHDRLVWLNTYEGPISWYNPDTQKISVIQEKSGASDDFAGFTGPIFDDQGALWILNKYNNGNPYFEIKLWNESDTIVLDQVDSIEGLFYQAGRAAWSKMEKFPTPCLSNDVEITANLYDRDVWIYEPGGDKRRITEKNIRNCIKIYGIDGGQVLWGGAPMPPPLPTCFNCARTGETEELYMGGQLLDNLVMERMHIPPVMTEGDTVQITGTVLNSGQFPLSGTVKLWMAGEGGSIGEQSTGMIQPGEQVIVSFTVAMTWDWKSISRSGDSLILSVTADNDITEVTTSDNYIPLNIAKLSKGIKKKEASGRGFQITADVVAPYATPVSIWFDDDAFSSSTGAPTGHFNPMATSRQALDKIEATFGGVQFPNGIDILDIKDFAGTDARETILRYWSHSNGIILTEPTEHCKLQAAPVASYLNWPLVSSDLLFGEKRAVLEDLLVNLGSTYIIFVVPDELTLATLKDAAGELDLPRGKTLVAKWWNVSDKTVNMPNEIMDLFGDRTRSVVVTNSRALDGSHLAAAPIAAAYRAAVLDVRDIVETPVSYTAAVYSGYTEVNALVTKIVDGPGEYDILGLANPKKNKTFEVFLVGSPQYVPHGVAQEPAGMNPGDEDLDWIATDRPYFQSAAGMRAGGRLPLPGADNVNYVARALQMATTHVGNRDEGDGWEDNILGAGIYNKTGVRHWTSNEVWWLDSVVNQLDFLGRQKGGSNPPEITALYENPSVHNGGRGGNWFRQDNQWGGYIFAGPRIVVPSGGPNVSGSGTIGDGINNDGDAYGSENNNGRFPIELISDLNGNGHYDVGEPILNPGLTPGIQATLFFPSKDEEIWDGFDNDGDGLVDEDLSQWKLAEVEMVYNEALSPAYPDVKPGSFMDLVDTNLIPALTNQGIIIYSGHAWNSVWGMSNLGGNTDPDGAGPIPAYTSDDRTYDQTHLSHDEIPDMTPALVIAAACGSSRDWEPDSIALSFLKKGALAYIGSTGLATTTSDEFVRQMFSRVKGGILPVGSSFQYAGNILSVTGLWAARAGEGNKYVEKTREQFTLLGLGALDVDPQDGEPERVTYSSPVFDASSGTWSVEVTVDIPDPEVFSDASGNAAGFLLPPDLLRHVSESGSYPLLQMVPFEFSLPTGGTLVKVALSDSLSYTTFGFSMPLAAVEEKWPVAMDTTPQLIDATIPGEPVMYTGAVYPDTLLVYESENDGSRNREKLRGSVVAYTVDGTHQKTTIYDTITFTITYTTPVGIGIVHSMDQATLSADVSMVALDGLDHDVVPHMAIETTDGIVVTETSFEPLTLTAESQSLTFTAADIPCAHFVLRVWAEENSMPVAETTIEEDVPVILLEPALEAMVRAALQKPDGFLLAADAEALTTLAAPSAGITDLTGLENFPNIQVLDLSGNNIRDISALAGLTALLQVNLSGNGILDITPLLNNSGLEKGATLDLSNNFLCQTALGTLVPQLEDRGVAVTFTPLHVMLGYVDEDEIVGISDAILALRMAALGNTGINLRTLCPLTGQGAGKDDPVRAAYILQSVSGLRP